MMDMHKLLEIAAFIEIGFHCLFRPGEATVHLFGESAFGFPVISHGIETPASGYSLAPPTSQRSCRRIAQNS